jgi:hypothetical protein
MAEDITLPDGTKATLLTHEEFGAIEKKRRNRERVRKHRIHTDPVDRAAELAKRRERERAARAAETPEQREERLAKLRTRVARHRGTPVAHTTGASPALSSATSPVTSKVTEPSKQRLRVAFSECIAALTEHGINSAPGKRSLKTLLSVTKQHLDAP